jgi:hypothetical protein
MMTQQLRGVLTTLRVLDLASKSAKKIAEFGGNAAVVLGAGNYGVVLQGPVGFSHAIKLFKNVRGAPRCVYCPDATAVDGHVGHYCADCHVAMCPACMAGGDRDYHAAMCTRLVPPYV